MINQKHGLVFQVYEHHSNSTIDQDNKFHRRRAGGHRIANFLRSHNWDVEVIDFAAMFTFEELQALCSSRINSNTKFIGFSCIFQSWPYVIDQFATWFKNKHPHIVIIWGGGYIIPQQVKSIDYFITGYGENALLNLLKVIAGNGLARSIFFDTRYKNQKVISADKTCPSFPMHELSNNFQNRDFLLPDEWGHIELSRGCLFKCKFCSYPVLGVVGDYTQDAKKFAESLKRNYHEYGIKNYYVVDETFNDSTNKIAKYADEVEKFPFDPFFSGFIRADLLVNRPEDRYNLLRMNFLGHYYGIESFHNKTAKTIGKGMDSYKLQAGLIDVKNFFLSNKRKIYRATVSMIIGLPFENVDSIKASEKWFKDNWNDQHHIWNPLVLPSKDSTVIGFGDTMSAMGLELEKYGYKSSDHFYYSNAKFIDWDNGYFSSFKAERLSKYLLKFYSGTQVGNLTLDDLIYQNRTIDHALLHETNKDEYQKAQIFKNQIVDQYKHKKLSI